MIAGLKCRWWNGACRNAGFFVVIQPLLCCGSDALALWGSTGLDSEQCVHDNYVEHNCVRWGLQGASGAKGVTMSQDPGQDPIKQLSRTMKNLTKQLLSLKMKSLV